MGIRNVNVAECDICGRKYTSEKKQSELLNDLKAAGWEGSISSIKCPACARPVQREGYYGEVKAVVKLGESYYVQVCSATRQGDLLVYIPYSQMAFFNSNTIPSIEMVKGEGKVKYRIIESRIFQGKKYLVADYLGRKENL